MDIGMLVLDLIIGEPYGDVHAKTISHEDLVPIEVAALGGSHAEVGGVLAEMWKLPPLLAMLDAASSRC